MGRLGAYAPLGTEGRRLNLRAAETNKYPKIAPGSLRRNERFGQEPKTGAQAKQEYCSAGMAQIQGAARGA